MLSLKWRDNYGTPTNITNELESIVAQFKALWLTEHNEDGSHRSEARDLAFIPVGTLADWPTATPPSGWLICDGSQVSRVTYFDLFQVIGTTFGAGDGSTTFNLPDARGRFSLSKAAAGTGSSIADTGGSLDHTHTGPSHTHAAGTLAGPSHTHTGPSHTHSIAASGTHTHAAGTLAGPAHTHTVSANAWDTDSASATEEVDNNLGGSTVDVAHQGHNHVTPQALESTSSSGTGAVTGSTAAGGDHAHGGATGAEGTGATGASGTGAVTGSTAAEGTGATGTNNPAYIVLGNKIIFTGVE